MAKADTSSLRLRTHRQIDRKMSHAITQGPMQAVRTVRMLKKYIEMLENIETVLS